MWKSIVLCEYTLPFNASWLWPHKMHLVQRLTVIIYIYTGTIISVKETYNFTANTSCKHYFTPSSCLISHDSWLWRIQPLVQTSGSFNTVLHLSLKMTFEKYVFMYFFTEITEFHWWYFLRGDSLVAFMHFPNILHMLHFFFLFALVTPSSSNFSLLINPLFTFL